MEYAIFINIHSFSNPLLESSNYYKRLKSLFICKTKTKKNYYSLNISFNTVVIKLNQILLNDFYFLYDSIKMSSPGYFI